MDILRGNAVVGQSGGPTAAINATLAGVIKGALEAKNNGIINTLYGMRNGVEGFLKEDLVDLTAIFADEGKLKTLTATPAAALGSCRRKLKDYEADAETYAKLLEIFKKYDIRYFFYIGGNDSMDTVKKLSIYNEFKKTDIKFMGVPKTIDNDLVKTDHTPGFGSAAKFVATVTKELVRDSLVYDLKSVTVVEIMGRDAGWLTGASALAKGDDCEGAAMVLLPEVPFDYEYVKNRVAELMEESKSLVITVSEGVRTKDGKYVCELGSEKGTDAFGHTMLTGTAQTIATMLKNDLGIKTRAVELSTLQRSASHIASATDIQESFAVGQAAVKAASEGHTGEMALLKRVSNNPYICVTDTYDVREVANLAKEVPRSMINENGDNVTEEFIEYVRPLIQGELSQLTTNGLPEHIKL